MISQSAKDRFLSLGIWAWLEIIEKEKNRLSDEGNVASDLLREDLGRLSVDAD